MNALNIQSPAYEGAGTGRRLKGWSASPAGPNDTVSMSLELLRRRSRCALRNSPTASSIVTSWVRALVGHGIAARPKTDAPKLKAKLVDLYDRWSTTADANGGHLNGLQQMAVHAWLEAGETFVRIRPRLASDGLPVPMQLQVLESDQLPILNADNYPGLPSGNIIRSGIELNGIGQRTAYWFWKNHPGDRQSSTVVYNEVVRVPASGVLHLYEPTRPGQLRGIPLLAPILTTLRVTDDFLDATAERQRLSNLFAMFITKQLPSGAADPMTGLPYQGALDDPIAGMEPGTAQELLPGEDVKFSTPPGTAADFDAYVRRQMLSMTSGCGLPYEIASGDLKDVSDRSLRIGVNEWRRGCEQKQWNTIIPRLLQPIRDAFCLHAALGGQLTAVEALEAKNVDWAPPAWAYMHPTQDVQRAVLEVNNGFRSRASVIAEMGYDPTTVDQERSTDKARADGLGLATADEQLAAAELAKLEAEAEAAQKQADAATAAAGEAKAKAAEAKASADSLRAQQATVEASRPFEIATAKDRSKAARIELRAVESDLKQIMGRAV
jgi:lambda family phage portal protein